MSFLLMLLLAQIVLASPVVEEVPFGEYGGYGYGGYNWYDIFGKLYGYGSTKGPSGIGGYGR